MAVLDKLRQLIRGPFWRVPAAVGATLPVFIVIAWATLSFAWPEVPVIIRVRWNPAVTESERIDLERRFQLATGRLREETTWEYRLQDASSANIRSLVQHERVDDTAYLDRSLFRPDFAQDRSRLVRRYSIVAGGAATLLLFLVAVAIRRPEFIPLPSRAEFASAFRLARDSLLEERVQGDGSGQVRSSIAAGAIGAAAAVAMWLFADAPLTAAAGGLLALYVGGYVVGALLIDRVDHELTLSWAIVRTVAGLLLTTVGFLASLALSLPWFVLPAALVVAAVGLNGSSCFRWPRVVVRSPSPDSIVASTLVALILSPIVITAFYMAPDGFPPVFYNVDTAYFLEKVHALTAAEGYPPPSLSNAGGVRPYHFGTHAMAALISRGTGLLPHQALFLILLPLLTAAGAAAAVAAGRQLARALPISITVPLLLISGPALSATFWGELGPQLRVSSLGEVIGNHALWGILSNEGQNLGGTFLILGSIAAIGAAPIFGWRLAPFLIGVALLVKITMGIALLAGFGLAEIWRAIRSRRFVLSPQFLATVAIFALVYGLFFVAPSGPPEFRIQAYRLYHLHYIAIVRDRLAGMLLDVLWLFVPVLVMVFASTRRRDHRHAYLLPMAIAPVVVVNAFRMVDVRPGMSGPDEDWLQILHTTPFLLHAFALSLASDRWAHVSRWRRLAFAVVIALIVVPVAASAGHYSLQLLREPRSGHEFVDNRPLAEALEIIPKSGSIVVTNDLRYPADGFRREGRQMQIPALFGHQAFAVNYAYEIYAFSRERRELQKLLEAPQWSDQIRTAAIEHGWTHLVIHKDYIHPTPIPLEPILENGSYAVFRFR